MNYITYSLINGEENSSEYYKKVEFLSNKIINNTLESCKYEIEHFMSYIIKNKVETIRSKEEYAIEALMIGVMVKEYLDYGRAFNCKKRYVFNILNKLREKNICKVKVDKLRGRLKTNDLMKMKKKDKAVELDDFKLVIMWMDATGDFKEEIYRLYNWRRFLELQDKKYISDLLKLFINKSDYLYNEAKKYLGEYTANVDLYLKSYKNKHKDKEDIIYCGKGEIQYFFNMISAEVMNKVYKKDFLESKDKRIFVPTCMRQTNRKCLSKKSNTGYVCSGCIKECNINILTRLVEQKGIKVYAIPHETMFLKTADSSMKDDALNLRNENIGIIGIACVLNLISGGWKALRLGFKPQCVVLDYCGCSKHWLERAHMTSINEERLRKIV